jgi:imidazolonepropionase-like amidohydrolase
MTKEVLKGKDADIVLWNNNPLSIQGRKPLKELFIMTEKR